MSDQRFRHLLEFFPTGTAEGEKEILHRVFVYADEFERVISPPPGSPHILVGTKGSGKTAVLAFSLNLLEEQNIPAIILSPMDVEVDGLTSQTSTGAMARQFYDAILDSIIVKLSASNSGLFDGDYATLYHDAVSRGLRPPDFLTKFGNFVSTVAKPFVKFDGAAAYSQLSIATQEAVKRATSRIIGKKSFYLFIDDTDQFADPSQPGHLNRVWALLLAARRLAYDHGDLKIVVSLRAEVWQRLQRDDHGQRDQTDHFRRLVVHMKSSREQVGKILDRRVSLAAAADGSSVESYEHFFDGPDAKAPNSQQRRLWKDLIVVRSRARPRDAIQLVNELASETESRGLPKVDESVFHAIMPSFSKAISEQYGEENRPEFPEALNYLRSLSEIEADQGRYIFSADRCLSHIKSMLGRYGATFNGVRLPNEDSTAFEVWRFLYASGVVNARVSDSSEKDGYKHLQASSDPYLVQPSRWNDVQKCLWEIDPVFRDFLHMLSEERANFTGLPTRDKLKKKRSRKR
ncbi:hypothetical protein [Pseudophaeobacter sp.]|uniref:P-loop ATPase, Sll1717 family n=1 Tax=Pseudophaeobacter sp. TaxID=1971739 RepID=UPI00263051E0|nr:hypothetical protein [Pseudophaeobacter sp.]